MPKMNVHTLSYVNPQDHVETTIRAVAQGGRVLFVAGDVCKALSLRVDNATRNLSPQDKPKSEGPLATSGGVQIVTLLTVEGINHLIQRNASEGTQAFGRWLFANLPTIKPEDPEVDPSSPTQDPDDGPGGRPMTDPELSTLERLVAMTLQLAEATKEAPPKAHARTLYRLLRHRAKDLSGSVLPPSPPRKAPVRSIAGPKAAE